jgi:hypothetical protein
MPAYSDKDQLDGRYVETTLETSRCRSTSPATLHRAAQRAEKLMTDGGSLLTLTYYGAEKWMPHYNVMGVAKAVEAWCAICRRSRRQEHSRQRDFGGADQDDGGVGHRRLPLASCAERI